MKTLLLLIPLLAACSTTSRKPAANPPEQNVAKETFKIKSIDVVYIHATDKKLATWYEKTLGLKKGYSSDSWNGFQFDHSSKFGVDVTSYPRSTMEKQSVVVSFEVDDVHAAVQELSKKGVRFYPDAARTISDMGSAYVATFEDPDGNYVQLSQPKK